MDCHITHSNSDITGGLFQLRMKISFPFLLSTVLRRFLLITRPRSFYSPISRGYICTFKVHLLQKYFPHDFSTDSLSCRKKSNLMKKISKRDSDKTETRQCYCYHHDSKENQHSIVVANPLGPLSIRCRLRCRLQSLGRVLCPPTTPPLSFL